MFRPAIVSTVVLCGLFLAAGVEAKSPNFINTPKLAIPKPLAANRILVLPRNITVPLRDEADSGMAKKKTTKNVASTGKSSNKKKKSHDIANVATETLGRQTAAAASSSHGPHIPDQLKRLLDPDASELARLRERLEKIGGLGNDDAFCTLFP